MEVPQGTPRRVRMRACLGPMGTFMVLFGGIWAVVGSSITFGFVFGGGPPWEDWLLSRNARPGMAVPIRVRATGESVNRRRVEEIRFRFRDAQGQERLGSVRTTDAALLDRARAGENLPMEYDPEKPSRARLNGTHINFFGPFILIPFAFAAAGVAILGFGIRGILLRHRLHVWGEPALGKITYVTVTNTSVNRRPLLLVRYSWNGPFGPVEGSVKRLDAPAEGAEVTVLYDAREPRRNILAEPGAFS